MAQIAPEHDEEGCEALAVKMDEAVTAGRKPTAEQQEEYDRCVTFFSCDAVSEAAEAGKVPREVAATNFKMMHYVNTACGHL